MKRSAMLSLGAAAAVGVAMLWHGPIGAAAEVERSIGRETRDMLDFYELPQVTARLDSGPLSRRVILLGPADDFQRRALVELVGELPGVNEVRWDPRSPVIDNFPPRPAPAATAPAAPAAAPATGAPR